MENDLIESYIQKHIDEEPDLLRRMTREAYVKLLRPRMISGHIQGRMLKMLVRACQPKRVLEIGTFTGYSAISMAEGLSDDGILYTLDVDDEMELFARRYIDQSECKDKIRFVVGDALQIIPAMAEVFDMVFIDGDKRQYKAYFDVVLPKVRVGGIILADNTLWDGKVLDNPVAKDRQTEGIIEFNEYIASDPRVEKVILPLRDGLTIIYKK